MPDWPHDAICVSALWYIRKHCMYEDRWFYTRLSDLHDELATNVALEGCELPIVSCYMDRDRWFAMTSARLVSSCLGSTFAVSPLDIKRWNWGDFKAGLVPGVGTACVQTTDGKAFYLAQFTFCVDDLKNRGNLRNYNGRDVSRFP